VVRGLWSASSLLCVAWVAAGCVVQRGCSSYERWYVGMAVPEGGVGGLLGVAEQLDVEAAAPDLSQC
jgi:hypothetical protein